MALVKEAPTQTVLMSNRCQNRVLRSRRKAVFFVFFVAVSSHGRIDSWRYLKKIHSLLTRVHALQIRLPTLLSRLPPLDRPERSLAADQVTVLPKREF
jgi:hypothetical protein